MVGTLTCLGILQEPARKIVREAYTVKLESELARVEAVAEDAFGNSLDDAATNIRRRRISSDHVS